MVSIGTQAQTSAFSETLQWSSTPVKLALTETVATQSVAFERATYQTDTHFLPIFSKKIKLDKAGKPTVQLTNLKFEPLEFTDIPDIAAHTTKKITADIQLALEQKQAYAILSFVPIRQTAGGDYEKLVSFDVNIGLAPYNGNGFLQKDRVYVQNSVLNQGDFYKFKVSQDGIHKIDFAFLATLGISQSVSLNNLRVYGNGGGMLPELAGAGKYDDLVENPIKVVDANNNGVFESGDYILFYAQGPDQWTFKANNNRFEHQKHLYSTHSYYFLNFDIGAGKRVAQMSAPATANQTVNTFDDYAFHESEMVNLNHSGRVWHGEEFNAQLSQDFAFNFPNLQQSIATYIKASVAARSTTTSTNFVFTANDELLKTQFLGATEAGYTADFAKESIMTANYMSNGDAININLTYNRASSAQIGWLDYIAINVRRHLTFTGGQMAFRDQFSVGEGNVAQFEITNLPNNAEVWDVTHIDNVGSVALSQGVFKANAAELRQYIAFDGSAYLTPESAGTAPVATQNLHAMEFPDMVIVTHPDFLEAAQELATYRASKSSLEVKVVTIDQVYNEFSSGTPDITAIRDYMKMYYDRAGTDTELAPKYLLLYGDASYDYKNIKFGENNDNYIPTYESVASLRTLSTYCSDDYYGFLDDTEGANVTSSSHLLDIAVGRFPVRTLADAITVVDKIKHYESTASLGDWRNTVTFIGDDEDGNTHFDDAEGQATTLEANYPKYNVEKIYLDAYQQISTPGGNRYPKVNEVLASRVFKGGFFMNYIGHGGEDGWAHERILNISDILGWDNLDHLPLFITATCSFSRYDNPDKVSAGEYVMTSPLGGAIAIVTTVRLVFSDPNKKLNTAFMGELFKPINGQIPTIGEITRRAKNTETVVSTGSNNRKFVLLGDPSLTLAYPQYHIATNSINETLIGSGTLDTLKALKKVDITGKVTDGDGNILENFNGRVYPTVFDKRVNIQTLRNDEDSDVDDFDMWQNIIFKGEASVTNGEFAFSFIVPKDINYNYGIGRISYYAENGTQDANGYTQELIIGGISEDFTGDDDGPQVDVFMNTDKFVIGGITDANPNLLIRLKDANGINTTGIGIGHDITAVIDEDQQNILVLNDNYKAALDSYQEGEVLYPLSNLEDGLHTISVKAWDVNNNSGKGYTEFVVANSAEIALQNVLNYPNPFTDQTSFWFEHNRAGENLRVTVQVFTLSGRLVKTIHEEIFAEGNRVDDVQWDGLDDFGNKIGRGVYVYKLSVRGQDDNTANKMEKLVILK